MQLGVLFAAIFAATAESSIASGRLLLAQAVVQPGLQPAATAGEGKIDHKPLERTPRGASIVIRAKVKDPARLFAPLVFARPAGSQRFGAYSMVDRGSRGFFARLPSSMLDEGSFEYFVEARHDEGEPTRSGSRRLALVVARFDEVLERPFVEHGRGEACEESAAAAVHHAVGAEPLRAGGPREHERREEARRVLHLRADDDRSAARGPLQRLVIDLPLTRRRGGLQAGLYDGLGEEEPSGRNR